MTNYSTGGMKFYQQIRRKEAKNRGLYIDPRYIPCVLCRKPRSVPAPKNKRATGLCFDCIVRIRRLKAVCPEYYKQLLEKGEVVNIHND